MIVDKLSPVSNMASSRSEENVSLKHIQHLKVSQCWCVLQFCFGHFCLECLIDVIANVCLAIMLEAKQFPPDLEEAMLETGKSLPTIKFKFFFFENHN